MCGIMGYSGFNDEVRALVPYLALAMQGRGKDSWGACNGDPEQTLKVLGPIADTYILPEFDHWSRGIFHTRASSHGATTIPNQHPFTFPRSDGSLVMGVHNGCVNWDDLDKQYPDRKNEVDSMHIFQHIAEGRDTKEIIGWGALAYFDRNVMSFCKFNMIDFHLIKLKSGPIVFCSLKGPMVDMMKILGIKHDNEYDFKSEIVYYIDEQNDLVEGDTMEFGARVAQSTYTGTSYFNNQGHRNSSGVVYPYQNRHHDRSVDSINDIGQYGRANNKCIKCFEGKVNRSKAAVCEGCLSKLITEVEARKAYITAYV